MLGSQPLHGTTTTTITLGCALSSELSFLSGLLGVCRMVHPTLQQHRGCSSTQGLPGAKTFTLGQARLCRCLLSPKGGMLSPCFLPKTGTHKLEPGTASFFWTFMCKPHTTEDVRWPREKPPRLIQTRARLKQLIQAASKALAKHIHTFRRFQS